jgi:hypothetical protein
VPRDRGPCTRSCRHPARRLRASRALRLEGFGGRHLLAKFQRHRRLLVRWLAALRDLRRLGWVRGLRMTVVQEDRKRVRDDAVIH